MLGVIWAIVIGAVIGAVAKLLMPGKDPGGFWITAAIGIAGSLVARFLGQMIGWYGPGDRAGFVASLLGAILLLWIYRMVRRPAKT